ncbi:penicillin-binding protein 2 [Halalkalibacterium halodurans]|uniref:peptidoglycan D,D-transpeptidase FtsI family protein n=1 Tax=Halalkalibacterium halodurans TaxID=86665 RepID=UPI0010678E41|nr:penicillin-binding protein 2 [Halalkalibacterium halodurans]TES55765.1 penicillin-binding protein 2 [Halalkalibacterium halodurans]
MEKAPRKKRHHVTLRLNVLFFAIFILFSLLILRLGMVQIVEGDVHNANLQRTSNNVARIDAPRGIMFDRYGHVVVDNRLELSLTYTSQGNTRDMEEMLDVAKKLEKIITVETDKITERDRKDYWLLTASEEDRYELVTLEERKDLPQKEEYDLEIERVSDVHLQTLTEEDERILAIFREMNQGYAMTPQRIKRNVTEEEAHMIGEMLDELPGVDLLRDASREYPYGDSLMGVFGKTGQIPREKLNYYLSVGYDRSDIVGTSYLEEQYEDVLRGQKAEVESVTTMTGGQEVDRLVNERLGSRGYDLVLSIDMEMQQHLEEIVEKKISNSRHGFVDVGSAYVVMLNPKTGDVIAMTGYRTDRGPDQLGVVNAAFEMGSSIKGASVLTGYHTGVVSPGESLYDTPIQLPGAPPMGSYTNMGWVNGQTALERSSNVYMFRIAMALAGYNLSSNCCWNLEKGYGEARYYFGQFGLGVETGIDLPSEYIGVNGGIQQGGNLLHLFIGQLDTYTTLQLGQYIATIANDGYRMQTRLVTEIREPSTEIGSPGALVQQFEPRVLNRIDMSEAHIRDVQQGLRRVAVGGRGTARDKFSGKSYQPALKTGTAQVSVVVGEGDNRRVVKGNNQALVGYAPYDDPEVAFAIIVPNARVDSAPGAVRGMAQDIGSEMLDQYFKLKEERRGPKLADEPLVNDEDDEENEEN